MSFFDHLEELRRRVWRSAIVTGVIFALVTTYGDECMRLIVAPYQDAMRDLGLDPTLKYDSPTQPVVTWFKVTMFVSLIFAAPYWVAQIWGFISAGLYEKEKRWVGRFVPFSVLLFFGGVVFGYTLLLPIALRYMVGFAPADIAQGWIGLDQYLSLFAALTLLLGATFLMPLFMVGLAKVGILEPDTYRSYRRVTILVIFIVSGILTPPDPITQSLVAIPLCFLFEFGIILSSLATGKGLPSFKPKDLYRNLRIPLVIVGLLFVVREPLLKAWKRVDADGKVESAATAVVPWPEVGAAVLGLAPTAALRIQESQLGRDFVVVAEGRMAVLRFTLSNDAPVIVNPRLGGNSFRAVRVQSGAVVWKAEPLSDLNYGDVLPKLRNAVFAGSADSFNTATTILDLLESPRRPATRPVIAEITDELRSEYKKRLEAMIASSSDQKLPLVQSPK